MAGNDHSGYPIKWFKDQNTARRFFECAICLEVLKDAVQVRGCGHQFCALCIDDILKANPRSPSCPSCRIEISDVLMVFEDHAARRMINQLEVNCCNEGCTWTGCISFLLQTHQNNCNFLIKRDDNNAQKLKLKELEQKHDTLILDVCLFKEKHKQDITDLKLKHEKDITELKLKHEGDIKELNLKHQKDIGDLQMKHEKEKQELRDLQLKHERERQVIKEIQLKQQQEKQLQLEHEKKFEELKLQLQRTEHLLRRMRKEEKDFCENEIPQKFSNVLFEPVVEENVKPVEMIPMERDKHLKEDLGWEDKEEKIGDEIEVEKENDADTEAPAAEKTRIKYERDFLLQLQYMPVCCEKPAGLPEIEIVLDAPLLPGKESGGSQRQKSQGGVKKRGSRKMLAAVVLERSDDPWQRPEEREKDLLKEEKISARANNEGIFLGPSSRFGQWGRGSSAGENISFQERNQPQGNRYSALSAGGDILSSRPYYPTRVASSGSRPSSDDPWRSDKSRIKSEKDRESALEAARNLTKPQATQPPQTSQEKTMVTVSKEPKKVTKEAVKKPAEEPLGEYELVKKTIALIDKYARNRHLMEAIACFTDLHSPGFHHLFILTAVEHSYEMAPRARHDIGRLFAELLSQKKLSKEQFTAGFSGVFELADDNSIDYPMLWRYLADVITPVILADQFTLFNLKPLILEHLLLVGKAAALLAEILLVTKELKGEGKAVDLWKNLALSWSEVLPERSSIEDFLSRKKLKFLPIENNDELLKLLCVDQFKNDKVYAFIEKNFKEEKRKEAKFINRLVTAVAESCIINRGKQAGPDCCKDKLKARKDILRKYLNNDITLELETLFALQEIYVKYNKPADMLSQFFNTLYDEEVLTKEAFMKWKQDESPSRQEAKGPALQATASFFKLLQDAAVENVMMQGQRLGSFIPGHPMAMVPRPVRGRVYSSPPQGYSPMQGFIPQQNMQYQVVGQDPYGQPVMRPAYIPNVQQAYQMQATSAPLQPQYIQQQQQYLNQGIPPPVYNYTMPNNQQIQQIQQQQQQQQPPAQTNNPQIPATNTNKPKPKRSSKIMIRDPKDNNKDVTDEILSIQNNTANGWPGGTPPLTTSTAQTESSTIQAQFAAQVAARVGDQKGNQKKSESGDKDKKPPAKTDQKDVLKSELNKQENTKFQEKQPPQQQQPPKTTEPPKKKSSKQRFKDMNKKDAGGDLMDAYTDKPPPELLDLSEGSDVIKNEKAPEAAVGPRLIKYDRDFLLQFRYKPVCLEKPASLPDHEIVLSAPNMPGEETGSLREGGKFLPLHSRQKKKRGTFSPENQQSRNGKQPKEPTKDPYGQPAKSAYVRDIQAYQMQGTVDPSRLRQPRCFKPELPGTFLTVQLPQSSSQINQGSNVNKPKPSQRSLFPPGNIYSDVAENDLYRSTDQRFVSEFANDQVSSSRTGRASPFHDVIVDELDMEWY